MTLLPPDRVSLCSFAGLGLSAGIKGITTTARLLFSSVYCFCSGVEGFSQISLRSSSSYHQGWKTIVFQDCI